MKQKRALKFGIILIVIALLVWLSFRYLLPLSHLLATEEGRLALSDRILQYGIFAPMIYIGLMAMQIVIAFIPGGPMEIIAGMLFGVVRGSLYSLIGAFLGTLLVLLLVRCFGKKIVSFFVSDEKMQSFQILHHEKRLEALVFLLYLLPGIPKDILTYVVPLTRIRAGHFLMIATLARTPALVASVMVGDSFTKGNYVLCAVICLVAVCLLFVGFWMKQRVVSERSEKT